MWNIKNAQTKQTNSWIKRINSHCQMGAGLGGEKKVKGLRSTNWQLQNSHEDVKFSLRNIVNNIVITTYGVRSIRLMREIVS